MAVMIYTEQIASSATFWALNTQGQAATIQTTVVYRRSISSSRLLCLACLCQCGCVLLAELQ
jgi:hypothetical protein